MNSAHLEPVYVRGEGRLKQEAFLLGTFALVCRKHVYKTPEKENTVSARNLDSVDHPVRNIICPQMFQSQRKNSSCYMVPFAKNDEEQGFVLIFFFKIEPRLLAIVNFLFRFQFFLIFMKSITMTKM